MTSEFYINFENKFRGDTDSIAKQLSKYNSLIRLVTKNIDHVKLIDIGSGRGEWLEKWSDEFDDCVGLENDNAMISFCRDKGLNIVGGDALDSLSKINSNSASVITIFHMIEHIENRDLLKLLDQCYRVLNNNGILIIETPSIDNIIVSSKTFYLDPTHISHINPDYLRFLMETIGFKKAMDFYINGGPLLNDKHSKITRIFNGVAQDLLLIATKTEHSSKMIFEDNIEWQADLNQAVKTMDAAVEFDLKNEQTITDLTTFKNSVQDFNSHVQNEIFKIKNQFQILNKHNNEIMILRDELRLVLRMSTIIKKFLLPFYRLYQFIRRLLSPFYRVFLKLKKLCAFIINKIFNRIIKNHWFKKLAFSEIGLYYINLIIRKFPFGLPSEYKKKIQNRLNKLKNLDLRSFEFNKYLLSYSTFLNKSNSFDELLDIKAKSK